MAQEPNQEFNFTEPVSPLMEMAIVMHETYSAFLSAGFSEEQSMQLLMQVTERIQDESSDDD